MTPQIVRRMKPLVRRAIAVGTLLTRPMTLGVRAAVFDARGHVFLVRHTYLPGWYMPGGGVDPGETARQAMARELREEGNIDITGEPKLFGLYLNSRQSRRNHVALYVVRDWKQDAPALPNREIAESGLFAPDALPEETTDATRRRLEELAAGAPASEVW